MVRDNDAIGILGTGSYVPEKILTNHMLEEMVETSDEWIRTRTGIQERRIAEADTATSDLALAAAKRALEAAAVSAEELDMIIVATITPDMAFPSTACILQDKLGAKKAYAFDISAACSGFIYALSIAYEHIRQHPEHKVLIIGAETLSKIVDPKDRGTVVLFGDGAGAAVIGQTEGQGILAFDIGSDGSGGELLCLKGGGSRHPATHETVDARLHYLTMSGKEVFKFAVRVMGDSAQRVLEKSDLTAQDIDCVVPHQANIRIIDAAVKAWGIEREKVFVNLEHYGNMSAASIPVALDEAVRSGKIAKNDKVILVGFGAGLTWASCAMIWS